MVNKFIYQQLSQHTICTISILAICILAIGILFLGAVLTFLKLWPLGPPSYSIPSLEVGIGRVGDDEILPRSTPVDGWREKRRVCLGPEGRDTRLPLSDPSEVQLALPRPWKTGHQIFLACRACLPHPVGLPLSFHFANYPSSFDIFISFCWISMQGKLKLLLHKNIQLP